MPLQDKTAEKMLNNAAAFIAATQAKPDQRAWDQLLIYCPSHADLVKALEGSNAMLQTLWELADARATRSCIDEQLKINSAALATLTARKVG